MKWANHLLFLEKEMKNKIFVCVAILFLVQVPAMAGQSSPGPMDEINRDCSAGGALDQFQCVEKLQSQKDVKLREAIEKLKSKAKSMWGPLADKEINARVDSSQANWLKYRDEQCEYGYYTKAKAHAPSQSFDMAICKYKKTDERIKEIENTIPAN
jgi:uncharacterized protein YecT (DUF1311 family)